MLSHIRYPHEIGPRGNKTPPTPRCLVVDSCKMRTNFSSVYLVEWSSVCETTVPYLVDHFDCLDIVLAVGSGHDREDSSSSNTLLMMVGQLHEPVLEELVGPSTLSAQIAGSDLIAEYKSASRPNATTHHHDRLENLTSEHAECLRSESRSRFVLNLKWS